MRSFAVLALAASLASQGDTEFPPDFPIPEVAVDAVLKPSAPAAQPTDKLELTLVCQFKQSVPAAHTLIGGHYLTVFLRGKQLRDIRDTVPGQVKIAAGTRLERTIEVDLAAVLADHSLERAERLTFRWPGVPGATASVLVYPDQSSLDVDSLNLSRTKVRLVTDFGEMLVRFFPDKAPNHVKNFIKLSKDGFYDGTRFHRVMKNFMIQGGCPYTRAGEEGFPGTGDPGYRIDAEFSDLKHSRGILSMARFGQDIDSAGCQFFVMHGDAPALDGKYSIFGQLEEGLDTLDRIVEVPVQPTSRGEMSAPMQDVWLRAAVVEPVMK